MPRSPVTDTRSLPVHPALTGYVTGVDVELPRADPGGRPLPYSVLPTPSVVLGFQYSGSLLALDPNGEERLAPGGVTGVQSRARAYRPTSDTRTILVRLHPAHAAALLGVSMREVAHAHMALASIWSASVVERVLDQLCAARTSGECAQAVQSLLLLQAEGGHRRHNLTVHAAVERILSAHGAERIETVAQATAISRRQLERLFLDHVGVGPKEFASLTRFAWTARHVARQRQPLDWAALALAAGYADQSHMVRAFQARMGLSPALFAAQMPFDPGTADAR